VIEDNKRDRMRGKSSKNKFSNLNKKTQSIKVKNLEIQNLKKNQRNKNQKLIQEKL